MRRMHLSPGSVWLTVLLGLLVALTPLGTDAYLPVLPAIAQAFGAPVSAVQFTITTFFIGIALGQLVWGPLSDRFGRKSVLLCGLALYLAAALACLGADSVAAISLWRFVQGLGMSSGPVIARTIVRDLHSQEQAARMLARMMVVFGVVPIAAPLLGAQLLAWWGWQAIFALLAAVAIGLLAGVATGLPETAPNERAAISPERIARTFARILREQPFIAPFRVLLCAQIGIFAFVANSAFVLVNAYGLSAREYSVLFATIMIGQIAGAWFTSNMVLRFGIAGMLRLGTRLACGSGVLAAALTWGGVGHWLAIVLPFMVFMFSASCIMPNATAAALSPFPHSAGTASSLLGAIGFLLGALVSIILGAFYDGSARPMTAALALSGLSALLAERFLVPRPVVA
ncbi:MAG: Bcr/CflA family efflux MFS transporter [Betaproteobacteria bacterium]|nr:Bcr/CflA family efflux MFS transporter [Betaproteobacteria bacterium]